MNKFVYLGIPPMCYGQSYYTLRSIFIERVPPPAVHMHIRHFNVAKEVPIGDVSSSDSSIPSQDSNASSVLEVDVPESEREVFDLWVRNLWQDKDRLISRFHETGTFSPSLETSPELSIPVELRHPHDLLDPLFFFVPVVARFIWTKCRSVLS
jgi:Acyltransferase C-terminus